MPASGVHHIAHISRVGIGLRSQCLVVGWRLVVGLIVNVIARLVPLGLAGFDDSEDAMSIGIVGADKPSRWGFSESPTIGQMS